MRKIIHIDLDAFFAQVELRDDPSLRSKPLIIGGDPGKRGVVCTACYKARKFGVHSAMPTSTAYRLCPQANFLYPNSEKYRKVSKNIFKIFHQVTDKVEGLSFDEAFLDVTVNSLNYPSATWVAKWIKDEIFRRESLTASAGVSSVKFVAKMASDLQKPNGLTVIPPELIYEFLTPLPVRKLWTVGKKTEEKMHNLGLFTVEDIRKKTPEFMQKNFGKQGPFLYDMVFGKDDREVVSERENKSRAKETTFSEDKTDKNLLLQTLQSMAVKVSENLKKNNQEGQTITLKVRFSNFQTLTRSKTLNNYTHSSEIIFTHAKNLLNTLFPEDYTDPIRLIGVSVSQFKEHSFHQLDLFD